MVSSHFCNPGLGRRVSKDIRIDRIEIAALQEVPGTGILESSLELGIRFALIEDMELRMRVQIRQVGRV